MTPSGLRSPVSARQTKLLNLSRAFSKAKYPVSRLPTSRSACKLSLMPEALTAMDFSPQMFPEMPRTETRMFGAFSNRASFAASTLPTALTHRRKRMFPVASMSLLSTLITAWSAKISKSPNGT